MGYEYYLWDDTKDVPKIEIYIDTYNHERYISQAIESILMQRTHYKYKVIIVDDCSSDNALSIMKSYQQKYPDKIAVASSVINTRGMFSRDLVRNITQAEYVASIDGDDYWTDPYKIEKDVSFLDEHPEYIGITGNVRVINDDGSKQHRDFGLYHFQDTHIYGKENVFKYEQVSHISALVHRNIFLEWTNEDFRDFYECKANGDVKLSLILGMKGNIYYSDTIYGDHRRVFDGISWTARTKGKLSREMMISMKKSMQSLLQKKFGVNITIEDNICLNEEQQKLERQNKLAKLYQTVRMYEMLLKCMDNGLTLGSFLKNKGISQIAIYGIEMFGQRVVTELRKENIKVVYAINQSKGVRIPGVKMYSSYQKDVCPSVDLIIVTDVTNFDEIESNLKVKGCKRLAAIDDIIYQMMTIVQNVADSHRFN